MRLTDRLASRTWTSVVGIVVVTLLVVVAAGCWGSDEPTVIPDTATTESGMTVDSEESTTTSEMGPTTTEAPTDAIVEGEVDGTEGIEDLGTGRAAACGIIKEVWMDGGTRKLKIDYIEFMTGDNAVLLAIEDGVISPGDYIEYYARNVNPELRVFDVSDSVLITTYSREEPMDVSDPPCSWEDFYGFWNSTGPPAPSDFGLSDGYWWIDRDGTGILSIEQQWVP